jgi:hypothetical protein
MDYPGWLVLVPMESGGRYIEVNAPQGNLQIRRAEGGQDVFDRFDVRHLVRGESDVELRLNAQHEADRGYGIPIPVRIGREFGRQPDAGIVKHILEKVL